jgi:hypothetical protein
MMQKQNIIYISQTVMTYELAEKQKEKWKSQIEGSKLFMCKKEIKTMRLMFNRRIQKCPMKN